jgi:hypothetical protein
MDLRRLLGKNESKYKDRQIIDEPVSPSDELLSQLAASDVMVASRFYNATLALMLSKLAVENSQIKR